MCATQTTDDSSLEYRKRPHTLRVSGKTEFDLIDASLVEKVNEDFVLTCKAVHSDGKLAPASLIGDKIEIGINANWDDSSKRKWFGIITEVRWLGVVDSPLEPDKSAFLYEFVANSKLHEMKFKEKSRTFLEQGAKDILSALASDHGISLNTSSVSRSPAEYVVQFEQSNFDFWNRIAQSFGINFAVGMGESDIEYGIFGTAGSHHAMKIGTGVGIEIDAGKPLKHGAGETYDLVIAQRVGHKEFEADAPDYKAPKGSTTKTKSANTGDISKESKGIAVAQIGGACLHDGSNLDEFAFSNLQRLVADQYTFTATSENPQVGLASKVGITHPVAELGGGCAVLEARSKISNVDDSGDTGSAGFIAHLVLQPEKAKIAPPQTHRVPPHKGIIDAVVVDDVDPEKLGRIKVKFKAAGAGGDDLLSCWCRVLQPWAGKSRGAWFLPRIADEVMIAFVRDDLEEPVVIGSVHNKEAEHGFFDEEANIASGILSESDSGYNEIALIDVSSGELIRVHAQKDMSTTVLENDTLDVGENATWKIEGETKLDSGSDITITSKSKITLKVGGSSITIDGQSITIEAGSVTVKGKTDLKLNSGATGELSASAPLTIKGAMVKIN